MIKSKIFLVVAGFILLAMLVSAVACTPAELQALQGSLKNVDSVSGQVTVTMKDNTTQTFNFSDVKVDTIKQALGTASLQVGDLVTIKASKDGGIEEVDSHNAQIEGVIKNAGVDNVTITTDNNTDITLKITSSTVIKTGNNQTTAVSSLKAGQKVEARYEISSQNAIRINVDVDGVLKEIQGTVTGVHVDNKTVTITTKQFDNLTLNIVPETSIRIGYKSNTSLSELAAGQKVEARYNSTNNNAVRINVDAGETVGDVQGNIKTVDNLTSAVTITTRKEGDLVLKITPSTIIRIGNRGTSTISDLKAGQKLEVKYGLTTKNALRINIDAGKNNDQNKGQKTNGQKNDQNNSQKNNLKNGQNNDQNNGQKNNQSNGPRSSPTNSQRNGR